VEGEACAAAEADEALFALTGGHPAFAADGGGAAVEIDVGDVEVGELAGADAGVGEGEDDGAVAELLEVGQLGLGLKGGAPGAGVGGGVEEGADLGVGEGVDDGGLGFGGVDGFGEVLGGVAFGDGPGPKGAEAGVDVLDGFGGEGFFGAFCDAAGGDPCGQELLEEGAELGLGDLVDVWIGGGEVGLQAAEAEFVVAEGVGAHAGDLFGEEEAGDGC